MLDWKEQSDVIRPIDEAYDEEGFAWGIFCPVCQGKVSRMKYGPDYFWGFPRADHQGCCLQVPMKCKECSLKFVFSTGTFEGREFVAVTPWPSEGEER